eukprot:CAMPEP_0175126890 /NCGR_PEP_ID=MMETSP0087-20121206/4100_1 /TAXON_ID=136419 /ORGANISM="Unknown Unknown, Strain D1" /LENGTH=209 /DNA_ID=CAMNT_0016408843 /DNA_START=170 /DNA_END=799 /DNA_ORIENTATION=-
MAEVVTIICILYLLTTGFFVLGWHKNMYDSYLRFTSFDSPQCLLTASLGLPLLLCFVFGTVGLLCLVHTPATTAFLQQHAKGVFSRADSNHDNFVDFQEFSKYQLGLQTFRDNNTSEFRSLLAQAFDDMDSNEDGFLTVDNMYTGIIRGMSGSRFAVGIAMVVLFFATIAFSSIFWNRFCFFKKRDQTEAASNAGGETEHLLGDQHSNA